MCKITRKQIQWGLGIFIIVLIIVGVQAIKNQKRPISVFVIDQYGDPIYMTKVSLLISTSGDHPAYFNMQVNTDENGKAVLYLPYGEYRFQTFFDGERYMTDREDICIIPGCTERYLYVVLQSTLITIYDNEEIPQSGIEVEIKDVESNVTFTEISDQNGIATFNLPQGRYQGMMYRFGSYYKSCIFDRPGSRNVSLLLHNPVEVKVRDKLGKPIDGVDVYAYTNRSVIGYKNQIGPLAQTNSEGLALFMLAKGEYRFYADIPRRKYLIGGKYICVVPDCDSVEIVVE